MIVYINEICGYGASPQKYFRPLQDEGTIFEILKPENDNEHGLIRYKDLDTSGGQSGAMITLVEDIPINIGMHSGGLPNKSNWGVWLSPMML